MDRTVLEEVEFEEEGQRLNHGRDSHLRRKGWGHLGERYNEKTIVTPT